MTGGAVARIKIVLDDVAPPVIRVLEVPLDIRLDRLHTVFQTALCWTDSHLWEMSFGRTGFGIPHSDYGLDGPVDARKSKLVDALEDTRRKSFQYLYDFGDSWDHSVKIERVTPADPRLSYPRLVEAVGERPPEDSGGPWGYRERLEALKDPEHEYHDDAVEALGGDYDPNAQPNTPLIEERMAALAKRWAPRKRTTR
jgi:hypothetical protein